MPDPDERGRVYEAMRACCADAETTKQAGRGPESGQPLDAAGQRGYRDEVPRFREMWAEHQKRWHPTRQPAEGQSPDAPGPHLKDGGVPSNPERNTENEALGRVREAERGLSPDARAIQQENKYEGWLEGFEYRLKDEGRLKEKIAEGLAATTPDATPSQVLRLIPDAIRYTYCFRPENYTRGYYDIKERLENRGHEMYFSKNWWTNPEYKGINTRWVTPEDSGSRCSSTPQTAFTPSIM